MAFFSCFCCDISSCDTVSYQDKKYVAIVMLLDMFAREENRGRSFVHFCHTDADEKIKNIFQKAIDKRSLACYNTEEKEAEQPFSPCRL